MSLKETVKTYVKAKRNLRLAAHKVAKSKSRITVNEVGITACFYKEISSETVFLKTIKKYCFGNTYDVKSSSFDMKPSSFCKSCARYSDRLEYEKNCVELKKQLENEQHLKQKLIDVIKKVLVKSK